LSPAVIVTIGTPAALAAKRATTTIPVIMATVGEVLRTGLVTNLAHPGGSITGLTLYADELSSKRLELFKEMVPGIERVAVLGSINNPIHDYYWDDMQPSGRALGLNLRLFKVQELNELSKTFRTIKQEGSEVLITPTAGTQPYAGPGEAFANSDPTTYSRTLASSACGRTSRRKTSDGKIDAKPAAARRRKVTKQRNRPHALDPPRPSPTGTHRPRLYQ
jgi:hypothetical protein